MSSRVLRKSRTRAAAKAVNYDEGANESDDDDEPILRKYSLLSSSIFVLTWSSSNGTAPRKRATRSSTGRSAVSIIRDASPADEPSPSLHATPEADVPATGAENSASGSIPGTPSETPSDLGPFKPAARKVRLRLGKSAKAAPPVVDDDEDEDELADENEEEEDVGDGSTGSESEDEDEFGQPSGVARAGVPMTARQAALAGLSAGSTPLISLDQIEANRRKGPEKTEEELAAKRREAAKRRKQQLVQKTQAEKEGAVDRLLNKQAPRPRARRNQSGLNTTAIGTPVGYATPVKVIGGLETRSASPDGDDNGEEEEEDLPAPVIPTMLRWVSTSRGLGMKSSLIEEVVKDTDVDMNVGAVTENPSSGDKQDMVTGEDAGEDAPETVEPKSAEGPGRNEPVVGQGTGLAFALCIPATILEQLTAGLPTHPPRCTPSWANSMWYRGMRSGQEVQSGPVRGRGERRLWARTLQDA